MTLLAGQVSHGTWVWCTRCDRTKISGPSFWSEEQQATLCWNTIPVGPPGGYPAGGLPAGPRDLEYNRSEFCQTRVVLLPEHQDALWASFQLGGYQAICELARTLAQGR